MLSPHEFTTLMVVGDAPEQLELNRAELHILLDLCLVTLELQASGQQHPRITTEGNAVLKAAARIG